MSDEAEWLALAAEEFAPAKNQAEPSKLRLYMRVHYDALLALKDTRGLSWPQVAAILSKRGITKADGSPLDGNTVGVMAAQVRWERDPTSRQKRKRRKPRSKATQAPSSVATSVPPEPARAVLAPSPAPYTAPEPQGDLPAPAGNPAGPYAEMERRVAEKKLRQEKIARAKDWNPYAVPQPKDQTDE